MRVTQNYKDKEWLQMQYWEEGKTLEEIAEEAGITRGTKNSDFPLESEVDISSYARERRHIKRLMVR